MKLTVLADIHANYHALQAVLADSDTWQPDVVIVAGDIVNRGARPRDCWLEMTARQRQAGWRLLLGNHEEYVLYQAEPTTPRHGPEADLYRSSYWTYQQLGDALSAELAQLPFSHDLIAPDGSAVCVVHASLRSTRDSIFAHTPDAEVRAKMGEPPPGLFVMGHTHLPLIRRVDDTLVVNVGAVGVPFDGDPRAAYGRMTWARHGWQAEIRRVPYDLALTLKDYEETGFLQNGGPLTQLMRRELVESNSQLFMFAHRYRDALLAGEIGMEEAVARYLAR
ncbi:MAG: metallophosphoesterase family protein [Caldilineales bacterium]|mgnify:CR=1 FL=1